MKRSNLFSAAAVLATAAFLFAAPASAQWDNAIGVGGRYQSVSEFDAGGFRMVHEQGWLPGIEGRLGYAVGNWTLFGEADLYGGSLTYSGSTQSGLPLSSSTGTQLARIRTGASYALTTWLLAHAAFEWERWRREIHGSGSVVGLQERSTSTRLVLGSQARWGLGLGTLSADAAVVFASPERLHVGFSGVLDEVTFNTRSSTGVRFGVGWRAASLPSLELRAQADWMRVGQSDSVVVTAGGRPVGTVLQPQHVKQSLTFSLRYSF